MHMADALLSPAVGLTMWGLSAAALVHAGRRVQALDDDRLPALMGVMGAFVFAAQMINFAIPGTGSSGHLGGGLLLAVLLGPHAALIVIASVLTLQALFFADGGLLALGANIFNLGVLPCWVAYRWVFRPLAGDVAGGPRLSWATMVAALVALQLGASGVVLQTVASGISSLPLDAFAALMLPIHGAIGLVEGLATAAILAFLTRAQPELLVHRQATAGTGRQGSRKAVLAALAGAALVTAVGLSWFASGDPDGLEWSVEHLAGQAGLPAAPSDWHAALAALQDRLAWMPDYALPRTEPASAQADGATWPAVDAGTSLAGLVGGLMSLALPLAVALWLGRRRRSMPQR